MHIADTALPTTPRRVDHRAATAIQSDRHARVPVRAPPPPARRARPRRLCRLQQPLDLRRATGHARELATATIRDACDPSFAFDACSPEDLAGPLEPRCLADADCDDGAYGRCVAQNLGFGPSCVCDYSCSTDADCRSDEACVCDHAFADDHSRCVPALCRTDDDCPEGSCGFSSWFDGCRLESFLACRSPADTCLRDGDCETGQDCAYDPDAGHWRCRSEACAIGRPLVVAGTARTAPAVARADWLTEIDLPSDLPSAVQAAIASHWAAVAALEHASVASFAAVTLDLMTLGAPPDLLAEAQRAALDEIEHARFAWSLASLWSGRPLGPGPLALDGFPLRHVLEDIVETLVRDGCVGETLGAAEAQLCAELAAHPVLAARLAGIASDETRHAALAWRTLRWLLASHGPRSASSPSAPSPSCAPSWPPTSRPTTSASPLRAGASCAPRRAAPTTVRPSPR
ncbi:ferritin-like domain-containing protein [Nannocystis pusilla]|uniref:ferritin-like domain-containing protein n=1 Tax=Nannocystis pusilla TaxID=889268 RepID=UPI003B79FFE7